MSIYKKYKNATVTSNKTGLDTAREILMANGLASMYVIETKGNLSDTYESGQKVIKLSTDVYHNASISSVGISAHQAGHAIQDKEQDNLIKLREVIYPLVRFANFMAYILFLVSLVLGLDNGLSLSAAILLLGIIADAAIIPVELDANKKAMDNIKNLNICTDQELKELNILLQSYSIINLGGIAIDLVNLYYYIVNEINKRR
jgi:Zn-dependent membrane protease YugP